MEEPEITFEVARPGDLSDEIEPGVIYLTRLGQPKPTHQAPDGLQ